MTQKILVLDDDPFLGFDIATVLSDAGFEVVGPVRNVDGALGLVDGGAVDAAVLDVNLGRGETSEPVALRLAELSVPFLFLSGYARVSLPDAFRDRPCVSKPFRDQVLVETVGRLFK